MYSGSYPSSLSTLYWLVVVWACSDWGDHLRVCLPDNHLINGAGAGAGGFVVGFPHGGGIGLVSSLVLRRVLFQ